MSKLKIGQSVVHDFSRNAGVIVDVRKDGNGYDYQVRWVDGGIDWYKRKVLELA